MRRQVDSIFLEDGSETLTEAEFKTKLMQKHEQAYDSVIASVLISLAWQLFLHWLKNRKKSQSVSLIPSKEEPDYEQYARATS